MEMNNEKTEGFSPMIHYRYIPCILGFALLARTEKGICFLGFDDTKERLYADFQLRFKAFHCIEEHFEWPLSADRTSTSLKLHLKGTAFQQKVWQKLIEIPCGELVHYGEIARRIDQPAACRAVGTAVGSNPVSFFIPCHRIIPAGGKTGSYHWGAERKEKLIGLEKEKSYENILKMLFPYDFPI